MNQEDHTKIITQIRESDDMAAVADLLGQLSVEHDKEYAETEQLRESLKKKEEENTMLRDTNMRLFQQITIPEPNPPEKRFEKNKKLSEAEILDKLFDEKGYIK